MNITKYQEYLINYKGRLKLFTPTRRGYKRLLHKLLHRRPPMKEREDRIREELVKLCELVAINRQYTKNDGVVNLHIDQALKAILEIEDEDKTYLYEQFLKRGNEILKLH